MMKYQLPMWVSDEDQLQHLFDDETEDTQAQHQKDDEGAVFSGLGILRQLPHDVAHVADQETQSDGQGDLLKLLFIHLGWPFYMIF